LGRVGALPGLRRLADHYDPLALQNVLLGILTPAVLVLLLMQPGFFRPDRTWWVLACALSFVGFGIAAAILRRTGARMVLARCIEALVMIPVLGSSSDNVGMVLCCAVTGPLVLVSAATILDGSRVAVLAGLFLVSVTLVQVLLGVPLAIAVMCGGGATVLSALPALVVLRYRRSLSKAVSAAEFLSRTDPLTGLLNRAGMDQEMPGLLERAAWSGAGLGVLLVDVDQFKRVNDTYGHAIGDEVLRRVAAAVRDAVRDDDVVTRLGGEEICVVGVYRTPADVAQAGERVRVAVETMPGTPQVTVSIGGAGSPVPAGRADVELVTSLLQRADELMYEVKQSGRNAVRVLGEPAAERVA
jgi:diguanylate cyclase (GGDEF)-like protein